MSEPQGLDAFLKSSPGIPEGASSPKQSGGEPEGLSDFIAPELLEDKYGGPTGALVAGASHVVNSALPGIGPALQNAVGLDYETQKGLTAANPIASGVGDVTAYARGAGVTGLISGAGKAMSAAVAPGLASKALQFSTEGALMGASTAINDLALGDPNLTAQKALTDIGFGAAIGIASAPIAHVVESAIPVATKKLSKALTSLKETALGTAEEPTVVAKALANTSSLLNNQTPESNLNALFAGIEKGETTLPTVTKHLDEILKHGNTVTEELNETLNEEANLSTKTGPIRGIPKKLNAPLFEEMHPERLAANLKTKELLFDYEASLNDFQKEFMDKTKSKLDSTKLDSLFKNFQSPESEAKKQVFDNYLENTKKVLSASQNYADYKQAETSISKFINSLAKDNVEMQETLKAMRGEPLAISLAKKVIAGVGASMVGIPKSLIGAAIGAAEAYKMVKNPYELGSALNSTFQKLKVFAEINEKIGEKIGSLSRGIFSNPAVRGNLSEGIPHALPVVATQKGYDNKVSRISELASNPKMMQDHLAMHTEDLYSEAPNVSVGLHSAMLSGVGFLSSKIPRPKSQMLLSGKWEPSNTQKQTFMQYYRAVTEPLSALKDVKNGTLTNNTMEALQATQPQLLQEMRNKVMEHLDPKKAAKLPYGIKMSLAKFMGEPLVEGMLPSVIMSNQMTFMAPQQSEQNAPKQKKGSMKELSLANRAETETEEHEKEKY